MTNEREKEEAKVTLEELLHQIQVIHLELKIVRNWGYFVFFGDGMLVSWIKRRNNEQGQPIINRLTSYSSKLPKIAGRRR
ncbi:TPA: hypothetical protein VPC71_000734 [Streptococcus pyogenes]|uniref:hypothetical protein n=1 Tax=Streptococcus pyogenes TaxID=1314 RepID=UPI00027B2F71|nr:hypothetical protein [Streptococcus pyogenes]EPZ43740.1 hypothetical protein HMPREF1228_0040 [Streptococcus pyogenes GA41345]HEP6227154.1 hypothetical protein [Streptococcus pyogenes ABC020056369]HEP6240647.1 hypothetical protein [Streptococcus pyogenes ABC020038555]HEP6245948.1 hypothetical protein [Streptococcus pyogenes ABC020029552]HEP6247619.1 hypothetical protein [Streptococcus pyogenes ABC020049299]HEP6249342.1 hypothetical protein [Streptococcus pyogenes ABC020063685]HEP6251408.1 